MFLMSPSDTPEAAALYQRDQAQMGFVMNLSRAWAWRPDVCDAFVALRSQLSTQSTLSPREFAVMVCATAGTLGDAYCSLAWGSKLAQAASGETASAVLQGRDDDTMSPRERALAAWTRQVVDDPNGTTAADVQSLRDAGFAEREIFEATVFVALRLAFSTVNDALGVLPDTALAEAAPPAVRAAVRYGRQPAGG
jgi:uncharacterized peroxidase-related enzyme